MQFNEDIFWMREALKLAKFAAEQEEVPIGAIIVHEGRILGKGYNQIEQLQDATAHAEILAISAACNAMQSKWLYDATMYVTLEPCAMCAGAIVLARMKKLVIAAMDPKTGYCGSLFNVVNDKRLNHQVEIEAGLLGEESSLLLKDFFAKLRSP